MNKKNLQTINAGEGWIKGNPLALLVEMQIDTAAMKNSMVVPFKTKNRSTVCPSSPTTVHIRRENLISKGCIHHNFYCRTVYSRHGSNPKCPSTEEQIVNCGTYMQMEYYSVRKRNEIGSFVDG